MIRPSALPFWLGCLCAYSMWAGDRLMPAGCTPEPARTAYIVRTATLKDPWRFARLNWWRQDEASRAVKALEGKPFTRASLNVAQTAVEQDRFLPGNAAGMGTFNYLQAAVEHCEGDRLDVVFRVFSVSFSPVLSAVFEFHQREKSAPDEAAGVSNTRMLRLIPVAGYDAADRWYAGGSVTGKWTAGHVGFSNFNLKGYGSSTVREISSALEGSHESPTDWLAHSELRLAFQNSSFPADTYRLSRGRVTLQYSGMSRSTHGLIVRFGAAAEAGHQQSWFPQAGLPPNILASTAYTSSKLYVGLTGRPSRQTFALSYGLGLGSSGKAFHGDWRKHVGDVSHSIWWRAGDHRQFELDHRLSLGAIQTLQSIPVAERFFGGNRQEFFVPGDTWQMVANPVVRSIPANRLYRTAAGPGGDRFLSYTSTTSLTGWSRPVVPRELTEDTDFQKQLKGSIASSTSILQVTYASRDPNFQQTLRWLPETSAKVGDLARKVGVPPGACTVALNAAANLLRHAMEEKPAQAFGSVQELLPGGSGDLDVVLSACRDLNVTLQDGGIEADLARLSQLTPEIQASFGAINEKAASVRAALDMSFTRRTLGFILQDMNIISISPALIFDVAHLGPGGETRFGVGGGIRISLVSSVNMTAGYAWNPTRRSGEGPGAFFLSLNTRNLP